jgi:hypothetical protein
MGDVVLDGVVKSEVMWEDRVAADKTSAERADRQEHRASDSLIRNQGKVSAYLLTYVFLEVSFDDTTSSNNPTLLASPEIHLGW